MNWIEEVGSTKAYFAKCMQTDKTMHNHMVGAKCKSLPIIKFDFHLQNIFTWS